MAEFKRVARPDDLQPGQGKVLNVAGKTIALFNVDGTFYAINNSCTHSKGPLGKGRLTGQVVTCPWHGARFDITTGQALALPATSNIDSYPIKVEGDSIWVAIS